MRFCWVDELKGKSKNNRERKIVVTTVMMVNKKKKEGSEKECLRLSGKETIMCSTQVACLVLF